MNIFFIYPYDFLKPSLIYFRITALFLLAQRIFWPIIVYTILYKNENRIGNYFRTS